MNTRDGGMPPDFEEQSRIAGEMLERSLLRAVSSVETELAARGADRRGGS